MRGPGFLIAIFCLEQNAFIVQAKGTLLNIGDSDIGADCLRFEIGPYAELNLYVGLWVDANSAVMGAKLFVFSLDIADMLNWPSLKFHASLEQGFHWAADCKAGAKCVTFDTRVGIEIPEVMVRTGQSVPFSSVYLQRCRA